MECPCCFATLGDERQPGIEHGQLEWQATRLALSYHHTRHSFQQLTINFGQFAKPLRITPKIEISCIYFSKALS